MEQQSPEITIIGCGDAVKVDGTFIVLEWSLNRRPDPEWPQFLRNPRIEYRGSKLRMHVEDNDIEAADSLVKNVVLVANQSFESQILSRRRREEEEARERESANEVRLQDARARLRKINDANDA